MVTLQVTNEIAILSFAKSSTFSAFFSFSLLIRTHDLLLSLSFFSFMFLLLHNFSIFYVFFCCIAFSFFCMSTSFKLLNIYTCICVHLLLHCLCLFLSVTLSFFLFFSFFKLATIRGALVLVIQDLHFQIFTLVQNVMLSSRFLAITFR